MVSHFFDGESRMKNFLLIGNPGVGKSTILNALIGSVKFKSGISNGKGLTTKLQEYVDSSGKSRFIDTPGLLDVDSWEKAAEEIKNALQKGGFYKIFFVITLEAGRIRPADQKTMKLVLEAVTKIKTQYSVIVNKLEPEVLEMIKDDELEMKNLINQGLPGTSFMYWNSHFRELNGKDNVLTTLTAEFVHFIMQNSPTLEIKVEEVNPIRFNTKVEAMKRIEIEEMRNYIREMEERAREKQAQIQREAEIRAAQEAENRRIIATREAEHQRIIAHRRWEQQCESQRNDCVLI